MIWAGLFWVFVRIVALRDTSGLSRIHGSDVEVWRVQTQSVETGLGFNFEGVVPAPYAMPNLQKGEMRVLAWSEEVWAQGDKWGQEEESWYQASKRGDPRYLIFKLIIYYKGMLLKYLAWHGGECPSRANISVAVWWKRWAPWQVMLVTRQVLCMYCMVWVKGIIDNQW